MAAPEPNSSQKRSHSTSKSQTLASFPLRNPTWSYVHLEHITPPPQSSSTPSSPAPLDALTAHVHITAALNQFLGLHGAAVPVDVLKLAGREVWIRVPAKDRSALVAAVGGWVGRQGEGWRVRGWSSWSAGAKGREGGRDLFGN